MLFMVSNNAILWNNKRHRRAVCKYVHYLVHEVQLGLGESWVFEPNHPILYNTSKFA
jgi:hypothetical protein